MRLRRLADWRRGDCPRVRSLRPPRRPRSRCGRGLPMSLGREPELFDVSPARLPTPDAPLPRSACPVARRPDGRPAKAPPRLLLVGPDLEDPVQAAALARSRRRRSLRAMVLTNSKSKQAWIAAHGRDIPFFHYGEILPLALAERTDICVFFGEDRPQLSTADAGREPARQRDRRCSTAAPTTGLRNAQRCLHRRASRHPRPRQLSRRRDPSEPRPDRRRMCATSRAAASGVSGAGPAVPRRPEGRSRRHHARAAPPAAAAGGIVFMPTNGIGLGHAQRCALIASALGPERPRPVFAAFPSCMRMVKSHGFDVMPLIGRSPSARPEPRARPRQLSAAPGALRRGPHAGLRRRIRLRLGLSHGGRRRRRRRLDPPRALAERPGQVGRPRPGEGVRRG